MKRHRLAIIFTGLLLLTGASSFARNQVPPFAFGPSERIVFVGNDFFDHETTDCYIETALTARFPDKNLTFRNLGYSGDTVLADARNLCAGWENFGPPDQGFNRLHDLIIHLRPTIVFVAYGMNESFAGPAGLADFQKNLDRMLDMLSANHARLVLISPIAHQKMPPPMPDPAAHNRDLELYANAIASTAAARRCAYIDLFDAPSFSTTDGVHLTAEGYQQSATAIETALGYSPISTGIKALSSEQAEKLRALIVRKNFDYFNCWRAQNDTYILGYRQHEQGRNAPEMAQFEKLAEELDAQIAKLRVPAPTQYELRRKS